MGREPDEPQSGDECPGLGERLCPLLLGAFTFISFCVFGGR